MKQSGKNTQRKGTNNGSLFSRRDFFRTAGGAAIAFGTLGFPNIVSAASSVKKMIVLGVDGLDPTLVETYVRQGLLPNCRKLIETGTFSRLKTSDPPQSPVAWSNFISGSNPGGHGIFDFIARDSETLRPYLSTSLTTPPAHSLRLGKFSLPLSSAKVELLRKGPTLWKLLQDGGIDSTAFRAPVNFPPTATDARTVSGITTPDIHGSYGIFSFYTNDPKQRPRDVAGGHIERIHLKDGIAECVLPGPANSFRKDGAPVDASFTLQMDASGTAARIKMQGLQALLREGEWSDWMTVKFPMFPVLAEVSGICRFYLRRVKPFVELYCTPVNIDPMDPTMPICTPGDYSRELVEEVGYFYTQGMPEDTAALSSGVFDDDDYRAQATFVLEERLKFFAYEINRYRQGFLYFYFSSTDLDSHMFWRCVDKDHPQYTEDLFRRHGDFLPWLYSRIDECIGKAMSLLDEQSMLLVVSDHGFVPFRRQFNLNSWLMDNGYAKARNRFDRGYASFFQDTDWAGTRAYGLGINSLYLNIRGREPDGIVPPGDEAEQLRGELIAKLKAIRDPQNGEPVITNVFRPEEIYSGPYTAIAPDLIVCYNRNYRASWDTILGKYPREQILDNLDPWSGDHCMDAQFLPGVFMCNRRIPKADLALYDMAPTILKSFGMPIPSEMIGRALVI
ncbi:MAG: alkaline phosphatase family protein [Verrucomicrobia bacterium]|nr:alkaline phosphatase family protein [Verrucomicrobiota bacterium]